MDRKAKGLKRKKRHMTAEDLFNLKVATSVSLSGDEKQVAYTVEWMDREDNKYYSNVFMHDIPSGESRQFTHGKQSDRGPVWSPDDKVLAFVSTRNKKSGIYLMSVAGGAERQLIEIDGAISNLQFTPDGESLVFCLRYNDSHFIEDEDKKKKAPVYRHITRMWFRLDGSGYLPEDRFQIYALDIETVKLRKLTRGKHDNLSPSVSPDGKWVAYVSHRAKELEMLRDDLFVIPFKGGKERRIETPAGPITAPTFSPDSKSIVYMGHANPTDAWGVTPFHVWKVGLSGRPKATDLMPGFDRSTYDESITDLAEPHGGETLFWPGDGKRIFFVSSDTGVTNAYYVPASGGKPTRFFAGKCHVKGLSINGRGRTAAVIRADLNNPGEVWHSPTVYGAEKKATRVTDLNPFLGREMNLGRSREVWFKSFDGTEVQGFLLTPPDFKKTKKYPSILEIHGGPRTQYAFSFFHEMQLLAARGYVVLYTNPRGGSGRGETWAGSIVGDWGTLDYQDCMAAADYLERQPYIDRKRMGVTGGSYGGYMTNWIIGHTHRFKAAVTQRSVVDLVSFVGSSDLYMDMDNEFGGWPWTNREGYDRQSPINYFKNVKTPVLIIHSEQDLRCNIEQADRMFAMLKILGKTTEMVRFPEEPHGLSRHGRPDRRIARLEWILKWFDRYLKR